MKVVIDIPDAIGEYYLTLFSNGKNLELKSADYLEKLYGITYQVLPKGHGRLIDADKAKKVMMCEMCGTGYQGTAMRVLDSDFYTPTIIDEDKGDEE